VHATAAASSYSISVLLPAQPVYIAEGCTNNICTYSTQMTATGAWKTSLPSSYCAAPLLKRTSLPAAAQRLLLCSMVELAGSTFIILMGS
jgi:hypothetical protein